MSIINSVVEIAGAAAKWFSKIIGSTVAKSNGRPTSEEMATKCMTSDLKDRLTGDTGWKDLITKLDKIFSDWDHDLVGTQDLNNRLNDEIRAKAEVALGRYQAVTGKAWKLSLGQVTVSGNKYPYQMDATTGSLTLIGNVDGTTTGGGNTVTAPTTQTSAGGGLVLPIITVAIAEALRNRG